MLNLIMPISADNQTGLYCAACKLVADEGIWDEESNVLQMKCLGCEAEWTYEPCCGDIHDPTEAEVYRNPCPAHPSGTEEDHEWVAMGIYCWNGCGELLKPCRIFPCAHHECDQMGAHMTPTAWLACYRNQKHSDVVAALIDARCP